MALEFNVSENAYVLEGKWEVADLSALEDDKKPIVDEDEKIDEEKNNIFRINLNVIVNGVWF